ncbi:hypothetical protein [Hyphococcus sp.]|uniref:hypothetical protein n=1 Tax=Hyphococcus sp. TaxID=2038636 RepID=UPI002084A81D|nr:MAG: hypothetical protein DHS20C04_30720 [Marinicaulis sp.]
MTKLQRARVSAASGLPLVRGDAVLLAPDLAAAHKLKLQCNPGAPKHKGPTAAIVDGAHLVIEPITLRYGEVIDVDPSKLTDRQRACLELEKKQAPGNASGGGAGATA